MSGLAWLARLVPFKGLLKRILRSKEDRYVALDTTASLLAQASMMFTTFALVRLLILHLGEKKYGTWATLGSIVALVSLIQIGVGPGLTNALSHVSREHPERGRPIVSSALAIQVSVAALGSLLALGLLGGLELSQFIDLSATEAESADLRAAFLILAVGSFLRLPTVIPGCVYRARLEGYKDSWIQVAGSLVFLAGAVLALYLAPGLTSVSLAQQGGMLAYGLLSCLFLFRKYPELRPTFAAIDTDLTRKFLREGLHVSFVSIASYVTLSLDNVIISQLHGVEAVASYAATMTLGQIGQRVTLRILDACWPMWSKALANGDLDWLQKHYRRTQRLIALVTFGSAAFMVVLGQFLVRIWTGSERVVPSTALLWAIAALFVSLGLSSAPARLVLAAGAMNVVSRVAMVNAIVSALASIALGKAFGVAGVAWGTVVAYSLTTWVYVRFMRSHIRELAAKTPDIAGS